MTLDVAFTNAGICGEDQFADDPGDWAPTIDVDFTAVNEATPIAVRKLMRTGSDGTIGKATSSIGLGR